MAHRGECGRSTVLDVLPERAQQERTARQSLEAKRREYTRALSSCTPLLLLLYAQPESTLHALPRELIVRVCGAVRALELSQPPLDFATVPVAHRTPPEVRVCARDGEQVLPALFEARRGFAVCACGAAQCISHCTQSSSAKGCGERKGAHEAHWYVGGAGEEAGVGRRVALADAAEEAGGGGGTAEGAAGRHRPVEECGAVDEDEEGEVWAMECVACNAVLEAAHVCRHRSVCARCLSGIDPPSGLSGLCAFHPGVHELPVDVGGERVFLHRVCDIGGFLHMSDVWPAVLPGRWTCCGVVCLHDHPQCPLFGSEPVRAPAAFHSIGCTPCPHAEWLDEREATAATQGDATRLLSLHAQLFARAAAAAAPAPVRWDEGGRWKALVSWNTLPPHHFEVSQCPASHLAQIEFN
eukprot:TRINITY_DN21794_c0_g1_i1.p1 TRINITY_DN21794_c0_g1~~TRINITY_DN21794_c0_g1_i1.p1  ORF type:complete len:411 (-),score=109.18 TRINITY_DN21794_c0_g1_i1:149-1381(-)